MPHPISLEIRCIDQAKKIRSGVSASLKWSTGESETKSKPPYRFQVSRTGEGMLEMAISGHRKLAFPFKIIDEGAAYVFKFHPNCVSPPLMATINSVKASTGSKSGTEYFCDFVIGDINEIILVAGYDYDGGSNNLAFATTRMRDLWIRKEITASTLISVFDFQTGLLDLWVKGKGDDKTSKFRWTAGWCLLSSTLQGSAPPKLHPKGSSPGADCISITHVYRHIERVGQDYPGSVQEFSVFSHSWFGGPILLNTFERPEYDLGASKGSERDPEDHDARFWKDFNSHNMPNKADFKAAFSPTSFLKIWGCLAIKSYRDALNKARKAGSDSEKIGVPEDDRTDFLTGTLYPDTRLGVQEFFRNSAYLANYMFYLSRASGRPVFGGPPGTGALYLTNGRWYWMYIPEFQLEYVNGTRRNLKPYYQKELTFMKKVFGWTFSSDNYLEYRP